MSKGKILIVDDDPVQIQLLDKRLTEAGFEVSSAVDGLDALATIGKVKPDLVVLDIIMPEINGYDVCYQLRFNQEYEKIPIIIVTETDQQIEDNIGQRINIEYLKKPIDIKLLIDKIKKFLPDA